MKKILLFISVILFTACNFNDHFNVNGKVDGGEGEKIYLEHTGLLKTTVVDSAIINAKGNFSFKADRPKYPDFYRLTLDGKQLPFSVDSIETIEINTDFDNFGYDYTISGSVANQDIRKLRLSVIEIQNKADKFIRGMSDAQIEQLRTEIFAMIERHKAMARPIILKNPGSPAAYYAIYQQVNNTYLFSPYNKEDKPFCAAVATSYQTYMPDYERTKNVCALVMDAINKEREEKNRNFWNDVVANANTGYINIELPDKDGNIKSLSSLIGNVILIDFSAYQSREGMQYTYALKELYDRYHSKGFEIYQVSLDRNRLFWERAIADVPWICVRDEKGPNSTYTSTYNVTEIPSYFLMDRSGQIIGRDFDLNSLEKEIEKNL